MRLAPSSSRGRLLAVSGLVVASYGMWSYLVPEVGGYKRQTLAYAFDYLSPNTWGVIMIVVGLTSTVAAYCPGTHFKRGMLSILLGFSTLWVLGIVATMLWYGVTLRTAGTLTAWLNIAAVLAIASHLSGGPPPEDEGD